MRRIAEAACFLIVLASSVGTISVGAAPSPAEPLTVAVKEAAPFVIRDPDGSFRGISIALWDRIASRLGLAYEMEEVGLQELIDGVSAGRYAVGVAPLTLTPKRERRLDFTHTYYATGLGIAVAAGAGRSWTAVLRRALSSEFLRAVTALVLLLLLIGIVIWIAERKRNPEQFGGGVLQGIGSGFWWSAVTMTTVGYGDKAPKSLLGRIVGTIWMFAAIIMISGFTASITSSLTVTQLATAIESPDDLAHVRVGSVRGSASSQCLRDRRIETVDFDDVRAGIEAVADGTIDAMVHDAPVLRYLVGMEPRGRVRVLSFTFEPQQYGFALPEGSGLLESINLALLESISAEDWTRILDRYLGD